MTRAPAISSHLTYDAAMYCFLNSRAFSTMSAAEVPRASTALAVALSIIAGWLMMATTGVRAAAQRVTSCSAIYECGRGWWGDMMEKASCGSGALSRRGR